MHQPSPTAAPSAHPLDVSMIRNAAGGVALAGLHGYRVVRSRSAAARRMEAIAARLVARCDGSVHAGDRESFGRDNRARPAANRMPGGAA